MVRQGGIRFVVFSSYLGENHEMMMMTKLDEGFARKVMIASHDSGGELIASQSNVCWQLFGSPHCAADGLRTGAFSPS